MLTEEGGSRRLQRVVQRFEIGQDVEEVFRELTRVVSRDRIVVQFTE
jgi:hypothetical protein